MRRLAFLVFFTSTLLAQNVSFRISTELVKVPVTVFGADGRLVLDLTRQDFRLFDEGKAQVIENFVLDEAPVNVLFLLDCSGSLKEELDEIREAALGFARSFSKEDRFAVISFADEVEVLRNWTNRYKALRKSLKKLKRGYRTALYDAVLQTVEEQFRNVRGRRVIILLTDGLDNESISGYGNLIPKLMQSDIVLYIVSRTRLVHPKIRDSARVDFLNRVMQNLLHDDGDFIDIYFREKETAMRNLAELTGGRVLFPEILAELRESYIQVARELKHQYVLTFQPAHSSDRTLRRIEVVCNRPVGRLHYRKQYAWR